MTPEFESLVLRACGALGNGVLQGTLVAVCVLVGLRLLRHSSAATRYAVTFAGLLTVAVLPLAHFLAPRFTPASRAAANTLRESENPNRDLLTSSPGLEPSTHEGWISRTGPIRVLLDPSLVRRSPLHGNGLHSESIESHFRNPEVQTETDPNAANLVNQPEEATLLPGTHPFLATDAEPSSEREFDPVPSPEDDPEMDESVVSVLSRWPFLNELRVSVPSPFALGALCLWALLSVIRLTILGFQCLTLCRLKRASEPVPDRVAARFQELRESMGVRRVVGLGLIANLRSPIAVGFFHPSILLPMPVAAAPDTELDSLLRHELAHIRRRDDWTNLSQQIIKALYFFHPGVLVLSRRLTLDREIACDDHVLAARGKPRSYALFLTDFASRSQGRQFAAAPAALSNPTQLHERIRMILDPHRNTSPRIAPTRAGVLTLAALLIAITGIAAAPRVSLDATPTDNDVKIITAGTDGSDIQLDLNIDVDTDLSDLAIDAAPALAAVTTTQSDHGMDDGDGGGDGHGGDHDSKPKSKSKTKSTSGSSSASARSSVTIQSSPDKQPTTVGIYKYEWDGKGGSSLIITGPKAHLHPTPHVAALPAPNAMVAPAAGAAAPMPANPPRQLAHGSPDDRELEERIRRLERLVDRLANKTAPEKPEASAGKPKDFELYIHPPNFDHNHVFRFEALSREMEKVSKDVERGLRDAERAARQSLKSAEVAREKAVNPDLHKLSEARRRSLEGHRDGLRKQIEALQANIDRLEGELDRLDDAVESAEEAEKETQKALRESQREIAESQAKVARDLEHAAREKERALKSLEKKMIEKRSEIERRSEDLDQEKEKDKAKQKQKAPDEAPAPELPPSPTPAPPAKF